MFIFCLLLFLTCIHHFKVYSLIISYVNLIKLMWERVRDDVVRWDEGVEGEEKNEKLFWSFDLINFIFFTYTFAMRYAMSWEFKFESFRVLGLLAVIALLLFAACAILSLVYTPHDFYVRAKMSRILPWIRNVWSLRSGGRETWDMAEGYNENRISFWCYSRDKVLQI